VQSGGVTRGCPSAKTLTLVRWKSREFGRIRITVPTRFSSISADALETPEWPETLT
jgi:hypothetical protein